MTADMTGSTNYLSYFALMADLTPLASPQLDPVGPELAGYSTVFSGRSEPESAVEVLLDGKSFDDLIYFLNHFDPNSPGSGQAPDRIREFLASRKSSRKA